MLESRAERLCVYCGEASVTKEDFFGRGVRKLLSPTVPRRLHQGSSFAELGPDGLPVVRATLKNGAVASGKLQIACAKCNNEWMGGLQSNVLPVLASRIRSPETFPPLDLDARNALAAWVTMVVMSYEFKHLPSQVVPQEHRDFLRLNRRPPPNWFISMGRYSGSQETAISHFGFTEGALDSDGHLIMTTWAQSTTFVLGNLLFHAYSSGFLQTAQRPKLEEMIQQFGLCLLTNFQPGDTTIETIHGDESANAIAEFIVPPGLAPHRPMINLSASPQTPVDGEEGAHDALCSAKVNIASG